MLDVGQSLQNGRYRIKTQLTKGGMGMVYLATDRNLSERHVAIKENLDVAPGTQEQFQREAIMLARLTHPNLPRVTDHFIEPSGRQYLVMDYIDGENLREISQVRGPLPEAEVLTWIGHVMDALAFMHGWIDPETGKPSPIIHRDIKPGNIKRTLDGRIVLVDFGLAKYHSSDVTQIAARAVTPGYSPTEQYSGGTDIRSDIYALGATLYTLLTGERPPDALAIAGGKRLPAPRTSNPTISRNTERVILRAMQLQPNERFQTVQEMRMALLNRRAFAFAPNSPAPARQRAQSSRSAFPPFPRSVWVSTVILVLAGLITLPFYLGLAPDFVATWLPTGPAEPTPLPPTATFAPSLPTSTPNYAQWGEQPPTNLTAGTLWTDPAYALHFIYVPAGEIVLGSVSGTPDEQPSHRIAVDAFWIMATEVTNAQYGQCVAAEECGGPANALWNQPAYAQYPVTHVSWYQANRYAAWVGGRLPSEVEWEKAARGAAGRLYPWGDEWNGLLLNYCDQQCTRSWRDARVDDGFAQVAPVGSFPKESASPYGLLDMAGNVREWTSSLWREYPYNLLDGREDGQSNEPRVARGGFWGDRPDDVRAANRFSVQPTYQGEDVGFRIVRTGP